MTLRRLCLAALFLAFTASIANAYTIVMRDKRRVEIPNQFTVTESTLTYEVGSGIQITIQLSSIDIAATEWVNGEQKGSFMLRASATPAPATPVDPGVRKRSAAARSITNKDLENYRQTRIQSELAYEKRRKELGLPSSEAARRESAAIVDRTRETLLTQRSREQEAEDYWRGRASTLRTEIASNEAQLDYVRRRIDELPSPNSLNAFSTTSPFDVFGAPGLNFPLNGFSSSQVSSGFGINIGTNTLGQRRFPYNQNRGRFHRGRFGSSFNGNLFATPYQAYDYNYERMELVKQLDELEMQRAGFRVRWRELEEEARRAGAYPGWLRP